MTDSWVLLVDEPSPKPSLKQYNPHSHSSPRTPTSIIPQQKRQYRTPNPNLIQLPSTVHDPSFGSPFTPPPEPACQPPSPPPLYLAPPAPSITPPPSPSPPAPVQYYVPSGIPQPPSAPAPAPAGAQYQVPTSTSTSTMCYQPIAQYAAPQHTASWNTSPIYHPHTHTPYAVHHQYSAPTHHDVYYSNSCGWYTTPLAPATPTPTAAPSPVPNYVMDERAYTTSTFVPSHKLRLDISSGRLERDQVLRRMNTEVDQWARKQKKQAKAYMKNHGFDLEKRKSFRISVKKSKIQFTLRNVIDRIRGTPSVQ